MLQISNLVLEVTRKCQLQCSHCLRGDAQRVTMSNAVLFKTFGSINHVCTLTLTGGEPSLVPEVFEELWNCCVWQKVSIGAFYIVTNGMNHSRYRRFLTAVERLYRWCDEPGSCSLTVSRDQYHPFEMRKHASKFEVRDEYGNHWGEYPEYVHLDDRHHRIERVLNEGRAAETQVGNEYDVEHQTPWELDGEGDYVIDPLVYVAANGNVVSCCNMSFDRIDAESKGNVLETPLSQIIESYCTQEVQEEEKVA
jgi:hypothetical protein